MRVHLNIKVFGKVQGVFYRGSTKAVADQLGIVGFVQNKPDGSVYIEVEGENTLMESFLEWCYEGPEGADVKEIEKSEGDIVGFTNFVIKK